MIRIEKTERDRRALWRRQGRLTRTDGEYFAQELAAFVEEQGGTHLDLDLRAVQFVSDESIEALKGGTRRRPRHRL